MNPKGLADQYQSVMLLSSKQRSALLMLQITCSRCSAWVVRGYLIPSQADILVAVREQVDASDHPATKDEWRTQTREPFALMRTTDRLSRRREKPFLEWLSGLASYQGSHDLSAYCQCGTHWLSADDLSDMIAKKTTQRVSQPDTTV